MLILCDQIFKYLKWSIFGTTVVLSFCQSAAMQSSFNMKYLKCLSFGNVLICAVQLDLLCNEPFDVVEST